VPAWTTPHPAIGQGQSSIRRKSRAPPSKTSVTFARRTGCGGPARARGYPRRGGTPSADQSADPGHRAYSVGDFNNNVRGIRVASKQELIDRIHQYFEEVNAAPVVLTHVRLTYRSVVKSPNLKESDPELAASLKPALMDDIAKATEVNSASARSRPHIAHRQPNRPLKSRPLQGRQPQTSPISKR
jgi:hypothetical protein